MKRVFIDMDGVLVNFQSGIDRLDEKTKQEYLLAKSSISTRKGFRIGPVS